MLNKHVNIRYWTNVVYKKKIEDDKIFGHSVMFDKLSEV